MNDKRFFQVSAYQRKSNQFPLMGNDNLPHFQYDVIKNAAYIYIYIKAFNIKLKFIPNDIPSIIVYIDIISCQGPVLTFS